MATDSDHATQIPLASPLSDVDALNASERQDSALQPPETPVILDSSFDSADLILAEHDSLLHVDIEQAPVSDVPKAVPWYAWALLAVSLVAVSSAAVVFASMKDIPTLALAAWRLQLTTALLSPAAVYQYTKLNSGQYTHFWSGCVWLMTQHDCEDTIAFNIKC